MTSVREQIMTKDEVSLSELLRDFFQQRGVDLQPPKVIFFNDREGSLLVYAARSDLQLIESIIQGLNTPAREFKAQVQVFMLPQGSLRFGWMEQQNSVPKDAELLCETNLVTRSGQREHLDLPGVSENPNKYAEQRRAAFPKPGLSFDFVMYLQDERVEISVIPSFVQSLGMDDPGLFVPSGVYDYVAPPGGGTLSLDRSVRSALPTQPHESARPITVRNARTLPLPRFRVRQITATTTIPRSSRAWQRAALAIQGAEFSAALTNDYLIEVELQQTNN